MKRALVLRVFHNRIIVVERQQEEKHLQRQIYESGAPHINFYKSNDLRWIPWVQVKSDHVLPIWVKSQNLHEGLSGKGVIKCSHIRN